MGKIIKGSCVCFVMLKFSKTRILGGKSMFIGFFNEMNGTQFMYDQKRVIFLIMSVC